MGGRAGGGGVTLPGDEPHLRPGLRPTSTRPSPRPGLAAAAGGGARGGRQRSRLCTAGVAGSPPTGKFSQCLDSTIK